METFYKNSLRGDSNPGDLSHLQVVPGSAMCSIDYRDISSPASDLFPVPLGLYEYDRAQAASRLQKEAPAADDCFIGTPVLACDVAKWYEGDCC